MASSEQSVDIKNMSEEELNKLFKQPLTMFKHGAPLRPLADPQPKDHPLYPLYMAAIEQAMFGKGQRHGGAVTPFMDQPWTHYAKMHGRGFLTGQAAKKLEEAASTRTGEAFRTEMLGAMVYIGMALLAEQAKEPGKDGD